MRKLTIGFVFMLAIVGLPAISSALGLEPVTVPEPATALLLAAAGFGLAGLARKR